MQGGGGEGGSGGAHIAAVYPLMVDCSVFKRLMHNIAAVYSTNLDLSCPHQRDKTPTLKG